MIVCPHCRQTNVEEATTCSSCGRSLDPGAIQLTARRTSAERPPVEIAPPRRPSRLPAFVVLGALVLGGLGTGGWYLFRPDPCRGANFSSANFGYCLAVPEGWTAQPANVGSTVTLDQFAPASQGAVVLVDAADLQQGTGLQQFADFVRQKDQQAGLTPGPIRALTVGGEPAQQWDLEATTPAGTTYSVREVVVVRDDVGWRVQLSDVGDAFRSSLQPFHQMLGSWRFR
ncbi:MAG TPA: hypothetical protein VF984_02845 [Actinomycetota bacterium]